MTKVQLKKDMMTQNRMDPILLLWGTLSKNMINTELYLGVKASSVGAPIGDTVRRNQIN